MGDSSKIKNDEILYIISVCRMPPCSILLSPKTTFFLSFEQNKLQGKCLKVQGSFQGVA